MTTKLKYAFDRVVSCTVRQMTEHYAFCVLCGAECPPTAMPEHTPDCPVSIVRRAVSAIHDHVALCEEVDDG